MIRNLIANCGKGRTLAVLAACSTLFLAAATWAIEPLEQRWVDYSVLSPAGPAEPPAEVFTEINRLIYAKHQVDGADKNLGVMAKRFGTTPMSLQTTNDDELLMLRHGQSLTVLNKDGQLYHVHNDQESLDHIIAKYYRGKHQAEQFKETVVAANNLPGAALLSGYELPKGSTLLLPKIKIYFDTYRYPFKSWGWGRISSGFGLRYHPILHEYRFHDGFDIPKPWGTSVYPARSGRVEYAGWMGGYGNLIIIRHSNGETTRYGHLSKIMVKVGQYVSRGKTLIGRVGSTGLSTGPHLHFEVRDRHGHPLNPAREIGRR